MWRTLELIAVCEGKAWWWYWRTAHEFFSLFKQLTSQNPLCSLQNLFQCTVILLIFKHRCNIMPRQVLFYVTKLASKRVLSSLPAVPKFYVISKKKTKPDLTWSKSFHTPNGWDDITGRGGGGKNEGNRTHVERGNSNDACNLILTHQQSQDGETLMRGFNCVLMQMWCDGEISCSRNTGCVCSDARAVERFKGLREVKKYI